VLTGQPEPRLHLCAVVASVQDTPPEHPYPLSPQTVEEETGLQPPGSGALRQLQQAAFCQPDVLVDVRLNDTLFAGREEFFNDSEGNPGA
jgi:hypothetical protein